MGMRSFALVLLVVCLLGVACRKQQDQKPLPKDSTVPQKHPDELAIVGTWKVVSSELEGAPAPDRAGQVYTFKDNGSAMIWLKELGEIRVGYQLDPSRNPKRIDMKGGNRPGELEYPGIYILDGDTLQLCLTVTGKLRPTSFQTKAGEGTTSHVLKRVEE